MGISHIQTVSSLDKPHEEWFMLMCNQPEILTDNIKLVLRDGYQPLWFIIGLIHCFSAQL